MNNSRYSHANAKSRMIARIWSTVCFVSLLVLLISCSQPIDNGNTSTPTSVNGNTPVPPTPTPGAGGGSPLGSGGGPLCPIRSSNPVTLSIEYSSETQAWIQDVVANFNSQHMKACDGPITVNATPIESGTSVQHILAGQSQPDIWSPSSSNWLTLLDALWLQKHSSPLVAIGPTDAPPLVLSPVVIAMWRPAAQALGWPNTPIGWADLAKLATNPKGWASLGHPEFGDFKFGHTHPNYSDSGLDAVIAEHYAATNVTGRALTLDDVATASSFLTTIESSVTHYGENTRYFADEMFQKGPNYLSAAVMYESMVVEANLGQTYPLVGKTYPSVVAIYPKEGTFVSDHPFAIMQASWVTSAKLTSALVFRNFLLAPIQQGKALLHGFRPGFLNVKLTTPISDVFGADPNQPTEAATLSIPTPEVVKAVLMSWEAFRHRVDVVLILDRSGSMNDSIGGQSKIQAAKHSIVTFLGSLSDTDALGLTVFSDTATVLTPVTPIGPKRQNTLNQINGIDAVGQTLLFDTIASQVQVLKALPSKHIKAVVVLTDGIDNISQLSLNQLISQVTVSGVNAGEGIKIFTIAYGNNGDVDVNALVKVANVSDALEFSGDPQTIEQVYLNIGKFF